LREKDDRCHASLVDSIHHGLRRADIKGERFVEQEVAACSGGTDRQCGLDIRRDGDCDGIHGAQELVEVVISL
jgi:hypothetical protein